MDFPHWSFGIIATGEGGHEGFAIVSNIRRSIQFLNQRAKDQPLEGGLALHRRNFRPSKDFFGQFDGCFHKLIMLAIWVAGKIGINEIIRCQIARPRIDACRWLAAPITKSGCGHEWASMKRSSAVGGNPSRSGWINHGRWSAETLVIARPMV